MDQDLYEKLIALLKGTKKVEDEAKSLRRIMLDSTIAANSQVAEYASVHPVGGSEFDFEIRCDQRKIIAHYSRFNRAQFSFINPYCRYQFFLYADALPGAEFGAPKLLLEFEFGRSGEFKLADSDLTCSPSSFFQDGLRNQVLVEVINQLQLHIHEDTIDAVKP